MGSNTEFFRENMLYKRNANMISVLDSLVKTFLTKLVLVKIKSKVLRT